MSQTVPVPRAGCKVSLPFIRPIKPCREESPAEESTYYTACQGQEILDSGGRLYSFVQDQLATWTDLSGDIAVWQHRPGEEPRLVAYIRPDGQGVLQAVWL